jgi:membrane protein implicated in regulation of membrane protease activity
MMGFEVVFWSWWVLAVCFMVAEMLIPAFFFLSMAIAGVITGLVVWIMPNLLAETQLLIFCLLSIISLIGWRKYGKKARIESDKPLLNKRGQQYIGRVFNLHEAIENGQGKVKVDDTIWKVRGADCDIDTKVRIVASHGTEFDVERVLD